MVLSSNPTCRKSGKNVTVKCTLVQALRLSTGRTAYRGSRGIALLFLDHGTRRVGGQSHAPAALYPLERSGTYCTEGWVGPRAGLDGWKISPPLGFDRTVPAHSQSLYRLRYPAHRKFGTEEETSVHVLCECETLPQLGFLVLGPGGSYESKYGGHQDLWWRNRAPVGTAVAQWLRCCATNRKVAGSIPAGVIENLHWHKILPIALCPWGRLNFLKKWVPGVFPWSKDGRCVILTTLLPSCAVAMKSWNLNFLEPSVPLQASNGTALPLPFTRLL